MFSSIVGGGMDQIFENKELNVSVRTVRSGEEVLFYAKDVAESLGYSDPKKSVRTHVWKKNRTNVGEIKGGDLSPLLKSHPDTVLLYEPGLYQLVCNSRLPIAESFQDWVFRDILPSIRKTGSYELPDTRHLRYKQLILLNESDFHYAVVRYIRRFHPDAVIIPGLGEYQDTSTRRCDAWKKGYKGGQPDLILANPMNGYTGFAIELKSPKGTGVTSDNQMIWLNFLRKRGYMTLISDDYAKTVIQINEYFKPDNIEKHKKETTNLKRQCNMLKQKLSEETACYRPKFTAYKY